MSFVSRDPGWEEEEIKEGSLKEVVVKLGLYE
jgi:hypothetical protein